MSDLLDLMVKIGGSVAEDELAYQCRRRGLDMNGSLTALLASGAVVRPAEGWLRAVDQVVAPAPTRRRRRRPLGIEQRRVRVAALYRDGLTNHGIADKLGVTASTVGQDVFYLRNQGVDLVRAESVSAPSAPVELP